MNRLLLSTKQFLLTVITISVAGWSNAQKYNGIIKNDGKYGIEVIKKEGGRKTVVKPKYEALSMVYETIEPRVYVYQKDGKKGIITIEDRDAVTVTKAEFDDIHMLNNRDNFIFDLKGYYFLVVKGGKTAILSYVKGKRETTEFWDEIGIDTLNFKGNYKKLFHVKRGNFYGLSNLFGNLLLNPEYERYEKLTDSEHLLHSFYKNKSYLIVIERNDFTLGKQYTADKVWKDKQIFWTSGKDTFACYVGVQAISDYRKSIAKSMEWENERNQKSQDYQKKQAKINSVVNGRYKKMEKVGLAMNKLVYLLVDTFGVKCFDPEAAEFVFDNKDLIQYWHNGRHLFFKSYEGKWYLYPSGAEYLDLSAYYQYFIAKKSDNKIEDGYVIFSGLNYYSVYVKKGAEITEVAEANRVIYLVYKLNGKYGFESIGANGDYYKSIEPVFDKITIVNTFDNNPRLQLILKGEEVNAYHDDIRMQTGGSGSVIKGDMYGVACGDPQCKNGILGITSRVEKGKTTTNVYENTTYWYKGHLVPATVTVTKTDPDKVVKDIEYCKKPVHSVKSVGLIWDQATSTYNLIKN